MSIESHGDTTSFADSEFADSEQTRTPKSHAEITRQNDVNN